jgi:hypothetical protein
MKDSDTIIQYVKLICPKDLDTILCIVKEDAGLYTREFMRSNKSIDFYAIPCCPNTKERAHDITIGYIASEDTTLTIDYITIKDTYTLKKGQFIWAFKQTSPYPIVAWKYYLNPIATGENVYEIRCLLDDYQRRILHKDDNHILTDGWCLKNNELVYENTPKRPLKRTYDMHVLE